MRHVRQFVREDALDLLLGRFELRIRPVVTQITALFGLRPVAKASAPGSPRWPPAASDVRHHAQPVHDRRQLGGRWGVTSFAPMAKVAILSEKNRPGAEQQRGEDQHDRPQAPRGDERHQRRDEGHREQADGGTSRSTIREVSPRSGANLVLVATAGLSPCSAKRPSSCRPVMPAESVTLKQRENLTWDGSPAPPAPAGRTAKNRACSTPAPVRTRASPRGGGPGRSAEGNAPQARGLSPGISPSADSRSPRPRPALESAHRQHEVARLDQPVHREGSTELPHLDRQRRPSRPRGAVAPGLDGRHQRVVELVDSSSDSFSSTS